MLPRRRSEIEGPAPGGKTAGQGWRPRRSSAATFPLRDARKRRHEDSPPPRSANCKESRRRGWSALLTKPPVRDRSARCAADRKGAAEGAPCAHRVQTLVPRRPSLETTRQEEPRVLAHAAAAGVHRRLTGKKKSPPIK